MGDRESNKRKRSHLPPILDGTYFTPILIEDDNVKAKCMNCKDDANPVSGKLHPTSNFTTHLKRHHQEAHQAYTDYVKEVEVQAKLTTQSKLNFSRTVVSSGIRQKTEKLIVNFVVQTMQPFRIVEDVAFRDLIEGLNPDAKSMCAKTLQLRISADYDSKVQFLQKRLENVMKVCLTADIWSTQHRSFMGVTCHWLSFNNEGISRCSTVLGLQRFPGTHSNDKIAEMLQCLISSYGLDTKVACIVTDNGSNFVKAFVEYSRDENASVDDHLTEEEYADTSSLQQLFPGIDDPSVFLPRHVRCASHTLNLVGKVEFKMAVKDDPQASIVNRRIMRSAMARCSGLWNKASRSVQVSEAIKNMTGKYLIQPVSTRWNSTFDAVTRVLECKEYLEDMLTLGGLQPFTAAELEFLEDYKLALRPIATMIDDLQSEKDYCYGYLVPTLLTGLAKLDKIVLELPPSRYASSIALELKERLIERFPSIFAFDLENALDEILATVSMPMFKMNWMFPEAKGEDIRRAFIKEAHKHFGKPSSMSSSNQSMPVASVSRWSEIKRATPTMAQSLEQSAELECLKYLEDPDESFISLLKYPTVKNMFFHLNAALPSSAPAERLFSYGGMILRPKRSRMADEIFEKLCFLKLYKDF